MSGFKPGGSPVSPAPAAGGPGAGLASTFKAKEKPIMLGAAALVAGLAYMRRRSAGGVDTAPDSPAIGQQFAGQGGGVYDSSSSDVYNALQPQIEQTQDMLSQLLDRINGGSSSTPAPSSDAGGPVVGHTPRPEPGPVRIPTPAPVKTLPPRRPAPRTTPRPAPVKAPPRVVHVVRKGENLSVIGRRYGTSWSAIYKGNRGTIGSNPNLILPGQRLVIPKK